MDERLYRSTTDRVVSGVAGGLAAWLRVSPGVVRAAWVIATVLSGGTAALAYVVLVILLPIGPGPVAGEPRPGADAPGAAGIAPTPPGEPGHGPATHAAPARPATGTYRPAAARGGGNGVVVLGAVLVALGAWLLVRPYLDLAIDWDLVWPFAVIAAGALLILRGLRDR